jgi:hypothetical protein
MTGCLALLALALDGGAADASGSGPLEIHRWEDPQGSEPYMHLATGASDDLWTSRGGHYQADGTHLGQLSFGTTRELEEIAADGRGGLLTISRTEDVRLLAGHDRDGHELWSQVIGERRRQRSPGAVPNEVVRAHLAGVDASGTIHVAGWLQGCVDLSGRGRHRACATWKNAGHPDGPELDSPPLRLFVNQYDAGGAWERTLLFDRMPDGEVAVDRSGVIAVTSTWSAGRALDIPAPDGTRVLRTHAAKPPAPDLRSMVAFFRPDGHPLDVVTLDAGQYTVFRSHAFDGAGRLWSFVEYGRDMTLSTRGRQTMSLTGEHCLAALTTDGPGKPWEKRFLECTTPGPYRELPRNAFATPLPDGRLLLANIPAEMAAGEAMGSLDPPPVRAGAHALGLMVLEDGRPVWHASAAVNHAVGLADGWICFTQLARIACARPRR